MAQHRLSLSISNDLDNCILCITDTSVYTSLGPKDCPMLQITVPGFSCAVEVDPAPTPGFCSLCLTACDLSLQTDNCGNEFCALPDGIYIIRWSLSPNDVNYVEYNFLRTVQAELKIKDIYCSLDLGACDPLPELKSQLNEIKLIESLIEAAKSMVEICHNPAKGISLFDYAINRLNKIHCSKCS